MVTCYDRNGNEDPTRFPCSADGDPAQCCDEGDYCATNGLCIRPKDNGDVGYFQNTCTDPDWINGSVPTCPTQCAEIRSMTIHHSIPQLNPIP